MTTLLPVAEAQARLIALARPLPTETVPLVEANGRWTAKTIFADRTQPFADLSAMDGYAIRFAEAPGPWTVVAESKAGGSGAIGESALRTNLWMWPLGPSAPADLASRMSPLLSSRYELTPLAKPLVSSPICSTV